MSSYFHRFISLVLLAATVAFPAAGATPRVLYVGDSWTAYPWLQSPPALRQVFNEPGVGLGAYEEDGSIALLRATALEWNNPVALQAITDQLAAKPTIDTIHISIGGNDILLGWKHSFTAEQTTALVLTTQN